MGKGFPHALKKQYQPGGAGAAAGTGVGVQEIGTGAFRKTILTLKNTPVVMADNAGVTAFGSLKVYDFPAGELYVLGAHADVVITKTSGGVIDTWDGDIGLGTVAANNTATPLATTEQNILPNTATPQAVAGVSTTKGVTITTAVGMLDGTSTAVDAFLNVLVDDTDHDVTTTPCNLIFNGTVTIFWVNLGDI
jgi:hypothetical protein